MTARLVTDYCESDAQAATDVQADEGYSLIEEGSDVEKKARAWAEVYVDKIISQNAQAVEKTPRVKALAALQGQLATFHYEVSTRVQDKTTSPTAAQLKSYKSRIDELWGKLIIAGSEAVALPEEKLKSDRKATLLALVMQELHGAAREFGGVHFYGKTVKVIIGPISFGELKLGRFVIRYTPESMQVGGGETTGLGAIPLEPNYAWNCEDRICHPHVEGSRICLGDGVGQTGRALIDGRYFDAMLLVREVLRTYSAQSPYRRLDRWTQEQNRRCQACQEMIPAEEGKKCTRRGCSALTCEACEKKVVACTKCKGFPCGGHRVPCRTCKAVTCTLDTCAAICGYSSNWHCIDCFKEGKCCPAHAAAIATKKMRAAATTAGLVCASCERIVGSDSELMEEICATCMTARTLMPATDSSFDDDDDDEDDGDE